MADDTRDPALLERALLRTEALAERYHFISQYEAPDLDDYWDELAEAQKALGLLWAALGIETPGEGVLVAFAWDAGWELATVLTVDSLDDIDAWCAAAEQSGRAPEPDERLLSAAVRASHGDGQLLQAWSPVLRAGTLDVSRLGESAPAIWTSYQAAIRLVVPSLCAALLDA